MSVDFLPKNFPPFQVHHAKKPPRFYPDGFQRNVIDFYLFFRIVGSEKPYICSFPILYGPYEPTSQIHPKMGVSHNADRSLKLDSSPETIRRSVEGSLKKLGTDYIDLYYQHRIDPKVEPETVAEAMAELIKEGKIRYWGISEATEEYLRRANAICPVTAIENRYSMMARWHETIFPVCEELNIAYVAFSPMTNGFLTGKYTPGTKFEGSQDYRASMPQYTEEGFAKAKELLDMLTKMAIEKNATMGQLSLAWMINKKPYIVPIPGSRKIERLKENFEAGNIVLTNNEIAVIDSKLDTMDFEVFGGHSSK